MSKDEGTTEQSSDPEVLSARHDVELARADLELRLRDVGLAGRRVWARAGKRARPFVIGGAIAVGILVLVQVVRLASRSRPTSDWRPPRGPSLLRMAAGAVFGIAMRSVTTALVRQASERLEPARLERNDS